MDIRIIITDKKSHKKSQIIVNNVTLKMSMSRQNTVICHQAIV